jgi:hypothetical protein
MPQYLTLGDLLFSFLSISSVFFQLILIVWVNKTLKKAVTNSFMRYLLAFIVSECIMALVAFILSILFMSHVYIKTSIFQYFLQYYFRIEIIPPPKFNM